MSEREREGRKEGKIFRWIKREIRWNEMESKERERKTGEEKIKIKKPN